jgi:DNA polymerase III delta' subunit
VTAASPPSFRGIRGQDAALGRLASALAGGRVPHAYLFAGPDGVGKRAAFFQWARALLCPTPTAPATPCEECSSCRRAAAGRHPDLFRADFETQAVLLKEPPEKQKALKIDTVREMEKALRLKPLEGKTKLALIDPADKLVDAAAHALLKVLEEPPPGTHIVLLASSAAQLLGTIRSRCQTVRFRPLPAADLLAVLEDRAAAGEPLDRDRFAAAARAAEGSVGRALEALGRAEALDFDWEGAPLSELLSWCEQFGNPRLGRDAAEDFLRRLISRLQEELRAGDAGADELAAAQASLRRLKRFVGPALALEALLLRLRRQRKRKR